MLRRRLPDFTRMLVGQHIVNGLSVGAGVLAIAMAATALFGFAAGQPATLGAISASISDLPAPWREKARSLSVGFAFALISTSAIQLALPWPPAALAVIGVVAFSSGMITGWGRWAVALGMQALVPLVFVLGFSARELRRGGEDPDPVRRRRLRLYRVRVGGDGRHRRERSSPARQRDDPRTLDLPARRRRGVRSGNGLRTGLRLRDPPAGRTVGAIAVGEGPAARSRPARLGKVAARGDDRRPARRLRRAHRRPMRHHENSQGAAVGDAAQAALAKLCGSGRWTSII